MHKLFIILSLITISNFARANQNQHPFIYFESGKSIPIHQNIVLDKNFKRTDYFWVRGFTDPTGSYEANLILSRKRANWVKDRLIVYYGVPESQIILTYTGVDLRPNITNSQKRRVEIYSGSQSEMSVLAGKDITSKQRDTLGEEARREALIKEELRREEIKKMERRLAELKKENSRKISNVEETKRKDNQIKDQGSTSRKKRYYVGAGGYQNVLKVKDDSGIEAKWVSKNNLNGEGQFQMLFGSLWIGARAAFYKQKFEQQDNVLYIWDMKNPNLYNFSLVFDYEQERFGIGADLSYKRIPFMTLSGNLVRFKDIGMYGADLRAQYKWYDGLKWSSRLGVSLDYPISGSGDINPKGELGYIGFVDIRKNNVISSHGIQAKLYYGFKNQKSIVGKQKDEIVGLQFFFMSPNWQ